MAHSLGVKVIAEGVETLEQLAFLRELRCDEVQGFYFSPALPAAEATALLQQPRVAQQVTNVTPIHPSRRSRKYP